MNEKALPFLKFWAVCTTGAFGLESEGAIGSFFINTID